MFAVVTCLVRMCVDGFLLPWRFFGASDEHNTLPIFRLEVAGIRAFPAGALDHNVHQ
jgi:hypothetical protein